LGKRKQRSFSLCTYLCVSAELNRVTNWVADFVLKNAYYQEHKKLASAIRK